MDFTLLHAAIALTTGLAAFVSVAFAIGYALIAVPILSLLIGTKSAIAIGLFFNVFTGAQFWFQRKYISWPDAIAILPASLLATLAGLFLFFHMHEAGLSSLLAGYLIVFVGAHWLRPAAAPLRLQDASRPPMAAPIFAGLLSGLFQGMVGIGGPPLATYLKARHLHKHAFRATLMLCFFSSNILRVTGSLELFRGEPFWSYVLPAIPFFIGGSIAGHHLPRIMSEKTFQYCVDVLLLLSAAMLIVKSAPELLELV
ncbi:MAG: sulfite exporter TauE/SafE family protein [Rhodomicrobium sp.]